jgi:hypothetical protein
LQAILNNVIVVSGFRMCGIFLQLADYEYRYSTFVSELRIWNRFYALHSDIHEGLRTVALAVFFDVTPCILVVMNEVSLVVGRQVSFTRQCRVSVYKTTSIYVENSVYMHCKLVCCYSPHSGSILINSVSILRARARVCVCVCVSAVMDRVGSILQCGSNYNLVNLFISVRVLTY